MNRGAALTDALLVTLNAPATWSLALAAFLVRGGIVLVALPIVVLPTPVGLGNILAPTLTAVVFGGMSTGLTLLVAGIVLGGIVWIVAGGLLAATLEAEGARIAAGGGDIAAPVAARPRPTRAVRILVARLAAHVPFGLALAWGSVRLVSITYRELTSPFDVSTPIAWRVLRAAPEVVAAIALTWMLGQILGAIAARRIALDRSGTGTSAALGEAVSAMLRRPLTVLADFWLPTIALVVAGALSALAAAAASEGIQSAASAPDDPAGLVLAVVLFVALWMLWLFLTALICAWRAAVWTIGFGEPSA